MSAISFVPSYFWEGNNGNWSTFVLQIGEPAQDVHVLPSTTGSATWVVDPLGCPEAFTDCPTLRGNLFRLNESSSFKNKATADTQGFFGLNFDPEKALGYNGTAAVGLDTVALGDAGQTGGVVNNQVVAVYADTFPWLGQFGLAVKNETVVDDKDQNESILGQLNSTGAIGGSNWAYTAGAHWRDVYASLTLGGYDSNRGDIKKGLTSVLSNDDRNVEVSMTGISITSGENPVTAGGLPISAFIDSAVPEIWLPQYACQAFETAFNLTWNEELEMYLVSDDLHDMLVSSQHNVTFTLASPDTGNKTDIVMPYAAFDLTATYPLAGIRNATGSQRYFPLKRAASADQYYLGRTFLQSAYLAVDYDRKQFAITQALLPSGSATRITPVLRPSTKRDSGLSTGAIAGIAIGVVALLALIGVLLFFFWRKKKNSKKNSSKFSTIGSSSIGGTTIEGWAEGVTSQEDFEPKDPKDPDGETEDQFKQELDATSTARPHYGFHHRHELSAGSVRRTSQQSGVSRASGVSPVADHRASGHRSLSSFGQPSPGSPGGPMSPREMSGMMSPVSGQSFPPMGWTSGPLSAFELHADSREHSRPVSTEQVLTLAEIRPLNVTRGSHRSEPNESVSPARGERESRLSKFEEQTDGPDVAKDDGVRSL